MFKKALVNVRPSEPTPLVMATPTNNTCRMNGKAASKFGINYKDVLDGKAYITAGIVDYNGEERLAFAYLLDPQDIDCAKLASPTKKLSGSLQFASAGVHQALEGDGKHNVVWKVTDAVLIDDEGGAAPAADGADGVPGFVVEFHEKREAGSGGKVKTPGTKATAPAAIEDEDDFDI